MQSAESSFSHYQAPPVRGPKHCNCPNPQFSEQHSQLIAFQQSDASYYSFLIVGDENWSSQARSLHRMLKSKQIHRFTNAPPSASTVSLSIFSKERARYPRPLILKQSRCNYISRLRALRQGDDDVQHAFD